MTSSNVGAGFHPGEIAVQRRAGLRSEAARLEGMLAPAHLEGGAARFLSERQFVVITGRDGRGRLWTSPLVGPPGFLEADATDLTIHAAFAPGDPLADMPPGQPVGTIAIEFAIRRRLRINGTLAAHTGDSLRIDAEEAFGNCPSYIHQRHVEVDPHTGTGTARAAPEVDADGVSGTAGRWSGDWTAGQRALIEAADTFLLGTVNPARGADTSHKGGRPGFVRIDGGELWWPDYAGNNMFNSMGNIAVNPEASLLFIDYTTGETVQLSGNASLEWGEPGGPGDDGDTGRSVRFRPTHLYGGALRAHSTDGAPFPRNPPIRPARFDS